MALQSDVHAHPTFFARAVLFGTASRDPAAPRNGTRSDMNRLTLTAALAAAVTALVAVLLGSMLLAAIVPAGVALA